MKEVEESQKQKEVTQISMAEQSNPKELRVHSLLLRPAGSKGTTIVKDLNKTLKSVLPIKAKTRITYTDQKLSSRFQIIDKSNEKHKHDLIYYAKCPKPSCTEEYLGETGHWITERTADHARKDKESHLLKHAPTQNHRHVDLSNINIIDSSFHNNS